MLDRRNFLEAGAALATLAARRLPYVSGRRGRRRAAQLPRSHRLPLSHRGTRDFHLNTPILRLTSLAHGGGCGCKLAASVLHELLAEQPAAAPFANSPRWQSRTQLIHPTPFRRRKSSLSSSEGAQPPLRPLHLVGREMEFCGLRLAGDFGRRMRENGRNSVRILQIAALTDRNCEATPVGPLSAHLRPSLLAWGLPALDLVAEAWNWKARW